VIATETAVIVVCQEKVLIWAIPHLLPQPPDFLDYDSWHPTDVTDIPPLFTIPFPDDIDIRFVGWRTTSSWYYGSQNPIHFDMLCQNSTLFSFQIKLKSDLSSASLHFVKRYLNDSELDVVDGCHICENSLFSCQLHKDGNCALEFSNIFAALPDLVPFYGSTYRFLPCPASGKFVVVLPDSNSLFVFELRS